MRAADQRKSLLATMVYMILPPDWNHTTGIRTKGFRLLGGRERQEGLKCVGTPQRHWPGMVEYMRKRSW